MTPRCGTGGVVSPVIYRRAQDFIAICAILGRVFEY